MGRRGMVMALALGMITVCLTMGTALLVRSLNESLLGHRDADRGAAFYLAEAGLDRALVNLSTNPDPTLLVGLTQILPSGSFQLLSATQLGANRFQVISQGTSAVGERRRVEAVVSLAPQSVYQYGMFGEQRINIGGSMTSDSYYSLCGPYNTPLALDCTLPNGSVLPAGTINKFQNGDMGTLPLDTVPNRAQRT